VTKRMIAESVDGCAACAPGLRWFVQRWPHGVLLTPDVIAEVVEKETLSRIDLIYWAFVDCELLGERGVEDFLGLTHEIFSDRADLRALPLSERRMQLSVASGEAAIALLLALEE
jgi:hypothetical protein